MNANFTPGPWASEVVAKEGMGDWAVEWHISCHSEGLTLFDSKTIKLYWPKDKPMPALFLHEIAHAKLGKGGHDSEFAHQFMRLVSRWMSPQIHTLPVVNQ